MKKIRLTESELIDLINRVIMEGEEETDKRISIILDYIDKQFKGIVRKKGFGWFLGHKNVLQYVNNHFIVTDNFVNEIKNMFGITTRDVLQLYKQYFKERYPRYKIFGVIDGL
jgi:hypothetical protein